MGTAKATLLVDGEPLAFARRAAPRRAVRPGARGRPRLLGAWRPSTSRSRGAARSRRSSPESAAVGTGTPVLLLACDLPFVTLELLTRLVDWPGDGTVVPVDRDGIVQPVCARYSAAARDRARRAARRRVSDRSAACCDETEVTRLATSTVGRSWTSTHRTTPPDGASGAPVASTHDHRVASSCRDACTRPRDRGRPARRTPGPARHRGADGDPAAGPAASRQSRSRSRCAPRATTSSSRSASAVPRGCSRTRTTSPRCATASIWTTDQEYNVVTVTSRRPVDLGAHRRVVAAIVELRDLRQDHARRGRDRLRAGRGRPGRRALDAARASPTRCATRRRSSTAPAGCTRPASSRPTASCELLREDVGRHNAVDKLVGHGMMTGDAPALELGAHGLRPAQLRDRAEGGRRRHPGGRRGVGTVEPRGRHRRTLRADPGRVPARRARQRLHAPRTHRRWSA